MASKDKSPQLAIGFRVKTGRATAIVMAGPASTPRVLSRRSLQLWDPVIPESHQPFHAELELPPAESARVVPQALKAVERVALSALRELVDEIQPALGSILGIALVAGSGTDPESIRNPHTRAHAREGQLFPHALSAAAKTMRIPALTLVESEVFTSAAAKLGKSPDAIKLAVTELGSAVGKPWSAEEKAAAAAAWIVLADR
ncbi:MAG TPA: hypothetical protein VJX68_18260 [Candidatus Binatus sp.]|uniref:hypothetical protein n=1 Tax=Candidatus Binatus sp. TaxID=2811406 RepID=UPI002B471593|nr:hypothetical protein [Candidatus Binatus sp.]HKN15138.1 hypothetical protein [Candidatus Binatus sp.]